MNKRIIYSVIVYNKVQVLCEYSELEGNFQSNCLKIMKKVVFNHSASIDYQQYKFNYLDINQLTILCFSHKEFPIDVTYCFLREVMDNFNKIFAMEEIINVKTKLYCNSEFEHILKDKMNYYNISPQCEDNLTILHNQILDFKNNVINADTLLNERDELLTEVMIKSEKLKTESENYFKSAKKVNSKTKCNKYCWILFAVLALGLIGWLISSFICGFDYKKCKKQVQIEIPTNSKKFLYNGENVKIDFSQLNNMYKHN